MRAAALPDQEREAGEDEEQYALSRFVPLLQEVLEDHASAALSTDEYPYVSAPSPSGAHLIWQQLVHTCASSPLPSGARS